ncbi:PLDc N-terminal domain-containing protein [Leifsonia sp. AG29]|uniref:PLDc N-terminal domain-containing protein n=1 Tax=Leifsonia sp. AG29 TaxID=2598860 RepID=UPI003FA3D0E8
MNGFWGFFWILFEAFVFVAYLMVLFTILVDLFRDEKLNGWWKALWVIFLVFVPFLTALVYLIARGRGMAERTARQRQTVPENDDYYRTFTPSSTPAADIAQAQTLLDQGTISQGEFDALKAKALGQRF